MALPVAQLMAQIQEGVVAEAEEMMEEAEDIVTWWLQQFVRFLNLSWLAMHPEQKMWI